MILRAQNPFTQEIAMLEVCDYAPKEAIRHAEKRLLMWNMNGCIDFLALSHKK